MIIDPIRLFEEERRERISHHPNSTLAEAAKAFMRESTLPKYSYNFTWMSRPIIQYPQDMVAVQEIIWQVKPDLIIETGIAHGGSLVLSASILALLDYCDALSCGSVLDPKAPQRRVLGIDIDIRPHNKAAIEAHPMSNRIDTLRESSIAPEIVALVKGVAAKYKRILVCLDSNHTHDHVLAELEAYAPLVTVGSYCVVFDTIIEDLPDGMYPERSWGKGDNPKSAVAAYLSELESAWKRNPSAQPVFSADGEMDNKLLISVAGGGYLKRIA